MPDNKSSDDKTTNKQPAGNSEVKKTAAGKSPTAKTGSDPGAKSAQATTDKPAKSLNAEATATIEKAGASKDSDMKSAAKKLSEADTTKRSTKSSDDLKTRAHEARQRAQKKILEKAYVSDKVTDPLERLANTFDSSAKRWEMVVYPSLFAFVLLAGYGFFLIYRLTHDISTLSQSVTRMAVIVSDSMPRMTRDMKAMTGSMDNMTLDIAGMTTEIISMSNQMNSLTPMSRNIQSMTHNIGSMNRSVYGLQRDMHGMNRTVSSGPFGMMNDIMPFSSDTNVPPPMPPTVWPAYNPNPASYPDYTQSPYARPAPGSVENEKSDNKASAPRAPLPHGK